MAPPVPLVREQLERILSSELFTRTDRLSAFLKFIVEQTLDGHGDTLKEQVIANELYGKAADFNTATDPIVRVDARRLRDRLREYYASAPGDAVLISVPKGSYTPVFETAGAPAPQQAGARPWRARAFAAVAALLIGAMVWLAIDRRTRTAPAIRLLRVTSLPGSEGGPPAVSPDGNFVAFNWSGPDFTQPGDLWVKPVEGEALRRLTDTPQANEIYPAWSPDGRQIAYSRTDAGEGRGVYVISALGGAERKLTDWGLRPSWLPDSQSLVFEDRVADAQLPVHYVIATGARRPLTAPPPGFIDTTPKVSPDGKAVAFVRSTREHSARFGTTMVAALFVVPLAGGEPLRLDDWVSGLGGPEWTPDSREIFYPRWNAGGTRIFRVPAAGGVPEPAVGLPIGSYPVSISGFRPGGTFRVAATDAQSDVGLRLIDLRAPLANGRFSAWSAFCDSTGIDWPGRFSRDGARVSFTSDRHGLPQLFTASVDGSQMRSLATFEGSSVGLAAWSPDGRFLAFDAVDRTNRQDLYVVGADGGPLRRLTDDDRREVDPEWSRDGRWIYFESDAVGRPQIWRLPAAGGEPVQLTSQGGTDVREGRDGSIFFLEPPSGDPFLALSTLKRLSAEAGKASTVVSGLTHGRWDVADAGIVFLTGLPGAPAAGTEALDFYGFADGVTRRLGELPFALTSRGRRPVRALVASPDGRWILVSHMDHWARDIVVADQYR